MSWRTIRVTLWSRRRRCSMDSSTLDIFSPTEASLKWWVWERERERERERDDAMYRYKDVWYGISLTDWKIPRWWLWPLLSCFLWESNCSSNRYDPLATPCLLHVELLYLSLSPPALFLCLGLSDVPGESMVKLYCPKCCDVYTPKSSRHHHIDGVYFGTGFPHMLFMVHPELRPSKPTNQFVPRYTCSMHAHVQ